MTQTTANHLFRLAAGWSPYAVGGAALAALIALRLLVGLATRLGRNSHPYSAAPSLLTPAEQRFFLALRQALGGEQILFAKVRLADLLQLDGSATGKHRWRAFTSISSKHADFVICDPRTFRVLGVVVCSGWLSWTTAAISSAAGGSATSFSTPRSRPLPSRYGGCRSSAATRPNPCGSRHGLFSGRRISACCPGRQVQIFWQAR